MIFHFEVTVNVKLSPEVTAAIQTIAKGVSGMDQKIQDLTNAIDEIVTSVTDLTTKVSEVAPAIDALEAAVTAALAARGLTQEEKDALDAAFVKAKAVVTSVTDINTVVSTAVADAQDGVDEANPPA